MEETKTEPGQPDAAADATACDWSRVGYRWGLLFLVMGGGFFVGATLLATGASVELDLRRVHRADTKLLAALVHALRLAAGRGVGLRFRTSAAMRPLIDLCSLQGVVGV